MLISRLHLEAFKSLYNIDCKFEQFSVITGPNGSGKSNLVEAFNFVGEVYADGLEFAVGRSGGYENLAHRRTRRARRPIAVILEIVFGPEDYDRLDMWGGAEPADQDEIANFKLTYRHTFSIGTATRSLASDFEIRAEQVEFLDDRNTELVSLTRTEDDDVAIRHNTKAVRRKRAYQNLLEYLTDKRLKEYTAHRVRKFGPTVLLAQNTFLAPVFFAIRDLIAGTRVFQLSPSRCRSSGVPTPNAALERYGDNLPAAADHLRKASAEAWQRVQQGMKSIMPGLTQIELVYTEDRRLAVAFREEGVGRPWSTGEMSDGTIQALALLLALHDPRSPVLVIEEPENSVHPWIIRQFIDLCRETTRKQIILTTHSPVVLNYVDPTSVNLMAARRGRSYIGRLLDIAPEVRSLVASGELSLFDVYDSGLVRSAVPRGYADDDDMDGEEE